jgi:hypothetical protein
MDTGEPAAATEDNGAQDGPEPEESQVFLLLLKN